MEEQKKFEKKGIADIFGTNKGMEKDGVIIDYGPFRVMLARAGGSNKKFSNIFQAKMKPYRRQIDAEILDDAIATKIMAETYAEAVILDMDVLQEDGSYVQGIILRNGEEVPFTKENVVRALIDIPDFFIDVQKQAGGISNFKETMLAEDVKN